MLSKGGSAAASSRPGEALRQARPGRLPGRWSRRGSRSRPDPPRRRRQFRPPSSCCSPRCCWPSCCSRWPSPRTRRLRTRPRGKVSHRAIHRKCTRLSRRHRGPRCGIRQEQGILPRPARIHPFGMYRPRCTLFRHRTASRRPSRDYRRGRSPGRKYLPRGIDPPRGISPDPTPHTCPPGRRRPLSRRSRRRTPSRRA